MSKRPQPPSGEPIESVERCPHCDSVVSPSDERCLMCGASLRERPTASHPAVDVSQPADEVGPTSSQEDKAPEPVESQRSDAELPAETTGVPTVVESTMVERQSPLLTWLTAALVVILGGLAVLWLRNPAAASVALFPSPTPLAATLTYTPTWTPLPSETSPPTDTPTITPTPFPTDTPRPPRMHRVESGETLFGLGLRYGVSAESISLANELPPNSPIQVAQELVIPWPTATPPLAPVEVELGGETVIADPTGCETYQIQSGDTLFGIAGRLRVDLRALLAVNRLTDQSILQPGDSLCIPRIIHGGVLPPTPGPSPTPTATSPPSGPQLLYPGRETTVEQPDGPLVLQWAAVKDLEESEWYMIEVTDLTDVEGHPMRGFTRATAFRVPADWRPDVAETHTMRWRVSIVQVTGRRADGSFVYSFGGNSSEDALFYWLGAVPTATPTLTPTPQLES
jgi:LysM repeat protein